MMSQTLEGARKGKETLIRKYGEDYFRDMGKIGGKAKNPKKGFGAYSPGKVGKFFGRKNTVAREYGRVGGSLSKRKAA